VIPAVWSIALAAAGVTASWLVGSRLRAGWVLALATQGGWAAYAITTRQFGFLLSAFAFGAVAVRNLRRHDRQKEGEPWASD
jgi:hypothetical protein